ncbi:MAG: hypothetical protein EHM28_01725 [Spirochaetaceae bacterium]|nr:MAG: hypothetical protein EHM28_01725 [Spirochaetaceae bacterium]
MRKSQARSSSSASVDRAVLFNFLRIPIGIFFFLLGLYGVLPTIDEGAFTLVYEGNMQWLEVIFGVCEMIAGVIILVALFAFISRKIMKMVSLTVLVFWLLRILITKLLFLGLYGGFVPNFAMWFLMLSAEAIIAAALYIFYRSYP